MSDSDHRPLLVLTPPDRPRGRGRSLQSPPVAESARALGIELHQTESVNEAGTLARIRAADPAVCTVCAFGQLIREPLLSETPLLNAHPSLLPRWRGAAPIERAIMAADEMTGVTIIRLVEELDAGPTALSESLSIGPDENYGELAARLAELSGELLIRALDLVAAGELTLSEQDEERATYAEKISPDDRRLDPRRPALELAARVRALTPHIGAYLELEDGDRLGIVSAHVEPADAAPALPSAPATASAGSLRFADDVLSLQTAGGALVLSEIKPPGGRTMSPVDYLRGNALPKLAR